MKRLFLTATLALALVLPGCTQLRTEPPRKEYFVVSAERRIRSIAPPVGRVLLLQPVRISPAFDQQGFVYRRSATRYETDFFREFFAPPARLVGESFQRWLTTSGSFQQVVDVSSRLEPDYSMEVNVVEIYGDYSGEKPAAVLTVQVALFCEQAGGPSLVHSATYSERQEIQDSPGAEDLVEGWNMALQAILTAQEKDLATNTLPCGLRPTSSAPAVPAP